MDIATQDWLESALEAVLFASGEAATLSSLADTVKQDENAVKSAINRLISRHYSDKNGVMIINFNDSYQMCTNPAFYEYVNTFFCNPPKTRLTQTILETLAIIAYKQPVTKGQIEEIRGVDAHHAVNRLVENGLVCEKGRLDAPGKPILFGTTDEFLKYFGLNTVGALPILPE